MSLCGYSRRTCPGKGIRQGKRIRIKVKTSEETTEVPDETSAPADITVTLQPGQETEIEINDSNETVPCPPTVSSSLLAGYNGWASWGHIMSEAGCVPPGYGWSVQPACAPACAPPRAVRTVYYR